MEKNNHTDSKTVLIIDDEPQVCEILVKYLEHIGYNTVTANNCNEVVLYFDKETPDIVFLDIFLPEVDGIRILRLLRKLEPKLPIVMISGLATVEMAQSTLEYGAFDYITKPFDYNRISDVLRGIEFTK